jgi:hypothetical protein
MQTVLSSWQDTGLSYVTFSYTYSSTPITGHLTLQINSQDPISCTCQAEAGGNEANGRRSHAYFNIHTGVTNLTALKQALSHEMGHTFGLADCGSCSGGSSAMTLAASMNDTTSGRANPSACDFNAARPHYYDEIPEEGYYYAEPN